MIWFRSARGGEPLILPEPVLGIKVFACKEHPLRTPLSQGLLSRFGGDSDLPVSSYPAWGQPKGHSLEAVLGMSPRTNSQAVCHAAK